MHEACIVLVLRMALTSVLKVKTVVAMTASPAWFEGKPICKGGALVPT